MEEEIINKVANSGLLTIDLEKLYPEEELLAFDIKEHLFMGLILKEKEFRLALKETDWTKYNNKIVAITCTADAIIPIWAYMLIAAYLQPLARDILFSDPKDALEKVILKNLNAMPLEAYKDQRVVVKGCGEKHIGEAVYVEITKLLRPIAKSIMYGEPCSTVPIFKKTTV